MSFLANLAASGIAQPIEGAIGSLIGGAITNGAAKNAQSQSLQNTGNAVKNTNQNTMDYANALKSYLATLTNPALSQAFTPTFAGYGTPSSTGNGNGGAGGGFYSGIATQGIPQIQSPGQTPGVGKKYNPAPLPTNTGYYGQPQPATA